MKFSEFNEELFVLDFFSGKTDGFFVDIGANNGCKGSNTYALENIGWSGIMAEADPATFIELERLRRNSKVKAVHAAICSVNGTADFFQCQDFCSGLSSLNPNYQPSAMRVSVPAMTIDSLVHGVDSIDFLTTDTEGFDFEILSSFSFRIKPSLIMVEAWDGFAPKFENLLIPLGYKKVFHENDNIAFSNLA